MSYHQVENQNRKATLESKAGTYQPQYDKVLLDPISVSNAKVVPPPWAEDGNPRAWALNADDARAMFGVDGSGVTVGVISNSDISRLLLNE